MISTISSVNIIEVTWTAVGTIVIAILLVTIVSHTVVSAIIEIDSTSYCRGSYCCECYYRNR